jgi:hypothetical protein
VRDADGSYHYIRIPRTRALELLNPLLEGYRLEFTLKGTPWESASLWLYGGEERRLATQEEAKELLTGVQDQPGAEGDPVVPPWDPPPLDPPDEIEPDEPTVLWSVLQTEIFSDGSVKVRRYSGDEFNEVKPEDPEVADLNVRDGSWARKFAFDYLHPAPGSPDSLIGIPTAGQAPGYDERWGENLQLPPGWVLNRGFKTGRMYLSAAPEVLRG